MTPNSPLHSPVTEGGNRAAAEKPAAEKPSAEKPAAETPAAEQPSASTLPPSTNVVAPDSASDGDAGERPVREKLKKTSIASIARNGVAMASLEDDAPADTEMTTEDGAKEGDREKELIDTEATGHMPKKDKTEKEATDIGATGDVAKKDKTEKKAKDTGLDSRGRPVQKRSLEDPDSTDNAKEVPGDKSTSDLVGHARKKSRDVRSGEVVKPEGIQNSVETSLKEEDEDPKLDEQAEEVEELRMDEAVNSTPPPSTLADQDMTESVLSPRRKRSRDAFETEPDREQKKIAATDETRRRRSSEEERQDPTVSEETQPSSKGENNQNGHAVVPKAISKEDEMSGTQEEDPRDSFVNRSEASPSVSVLPKHSSVETQDTHNKDTISKQTQTSSAAFASSGFAALSGSSTSPFGALGVGAKSAAKGQDPPALSSFAAPRGSSTEETKPASLGFGASAPSPFASGKIMGFGSTGTSGFGSGFGGGFGGGSKLSGFAAPNGDDLLSARKSKPFGASATSGEENSGSEDGGDGDAEEGSEHHDEEGGRAQKHEHTGEEGEDTIFINRGKLFQFQHDKGWAERGLGPFKLNVKRNKGDEDDSAEPVKKAKLEARFIMRTAATHRVVLNAPIFKQMSIGDARGKDPTGKTVYFSVSVDGKLIPHMLKMTKEDEVKRLFLEVRRLQERM